MTDRLRDELEELLSEDVASAQRRERAAFDELASPYQERLVLFGAGNLGRRVLTVLCGSGVEPLAFADNNVALWGQEIEGVRVLSPEDAARGYGKSAAFVVTIWNEHHGFPAVHEKLGQLGCERVISCGTLLWKHAQAFLPYFCVDAPHKVLQQAGEVRRCFGLWADDASRREYLAQLRLRLHMDLEGLPPPRPGSPYFPAELYRLSDREVLVDCGAYTGDTIQDFLARTEGQFAAIVAFEPDPGSVRALRDYVAALPEESRRKVTVVQAATSDRAGVLRFAATGGLGSALSDVGDVEVKAVALDHALEGLHPTIVKFDIEGAELDALAGSRNLIGSETPILEISVYHLQDHLWRAALLVADWSDQYRFALHSHGHNGLATVCYAVPAQRAV